eukprot:363192-Chlamydomonas_euryale.AAC.10
MPANHDPDHHTVKLRDQPLWRGIPHPTPSSAATRLSGDISWMLTCTWLPFAPCQAARPPCSQAPRPALAAG